MWLRKYNKSVMRKKLEPGLSYFDLIKSSNEEYLNKKKMVISDCDGVLTDGTSLYDQDKKSLKVYGAYDSEMIKFLKTQGWEFMFVSKDLLGFDITSKRISDLNCHIVEADEVLRDELVKNHVNAGYTVLFVGDSLTDIRSMSDATYAACTKNAPEIVYEYTDYTSKNKGGHGGFGEILLWIHNTLK